MRTSLLYDLRSPDRQTTRLIDAAASKDSFHLFVDEWRSPIWVENLADALLGLASKDISGLLHLGGPQALNRWELGMKLLQHFDVIPNSNIQKGTIEESGRVRPSNLILDSTSALQLLETPLLSLPEARKKVKNHKF